MKYKRFYVRLGGAYLSVVLFNLTLYLLLSDINKYLLPALLVIFWPLQLPMSLLYLCLLVAGFNCEGFIMASRIIAIISYLYFILLMYLQWERIFDFYQKKSNKIKMSKKESAILLFTLSIIILLIFLTIILPMI